MNVYSELFYDNDLEAQVDAVTSDEAKMLKRLSPILPNSDERDVAQGMIFFGVEGKSETCTDSPSWLNNAEAKHVS